MISSVNHLLTSDFDHESSGEARENSDAWLELRISHLQSEGRPRGFFHIDVWKLGLSDAVKHNGVAQIIALSNESDNLNAICQDLLSQCASKFDITLLLHENLLRAWRSFQFQHCRDADFVHPIREVA